MKKILFTLLVVLLSLLIVTCGKGGDASEDGESDSSTLNIIKERGKLLCGSSTGLAGFSSADSNGEWVGLDVDICRAVAAAVFGDDSLIEYVPLTAKERFTALQSGQIDMLSRNTTWTATRDSSLGVIFAGVNYYDGQGFLVNKSLNAKTSKDLDGATFCLQSGTTTELNLADHFKEMGMTYKVVTFDTSEQSISGFQDGRCDVLTSDHSQLSALKLTLDKPDAAEVLSQVISKEPLGPVVRQGDDQWLNIVKWSLYAMLEAEELNLNSENIASAKDDPSASPAIKRYVGSEGQVGENLGLSSDWSYNIISIVGNYGESYERNVGSSSPLNISRAGSVNANWKKGGLMYPMAFR